jgi:hypothetical protein
VAQLSSAHHACAVLVKHTEAFDKVGLLAEILLVADRGVDGQELFERDPLLSSGIRFRNNLLDIRLGRVEAKSSEGCAQLVQVDLAIAALVKEGKRVPQLVGDCILNADH